jgi:membrane-associated phospholipid phosphatase
MADSALGRGEIAWSSREIPARPPMLPLFGKVSAWMMTPADIAADRPPPPPSTSSQQMKDELAVVKNTVDHLTTAQLAIAQKWNDGAATYTPPGHWNDVALDYVREANMSEVRAARVFALLNIAMHDAAVGCWEAKFHYFNPRPSQLDPSIKTEIGLPNFPSYTSGHSTFSAAAAAVLSYVFPSGAASFAAMRDEAGISRLYGGIHYPSDIAEGKAHGVRIAAHTLTFAQADGAP